VAVRWPDGSVTGSVRVGKRAPAPVEPEPEETTEEPEKVPEKKESKDAHR
jgi:hypothetical protein